MKEKICKLIDVKSIITILISVVFCVLSLKGIISAEQFVCIFTTIVAFYFGIQKEKKDGKSE